MKFLYSDTQDYVDPGYDFKTDTYSPGRKKYWNDKYAHELMATPPYDGLLVSMSGLKSPSDLPKGVSRYTSAETQRFLRDGARKFLRVDGPRFLDMMLMGDCGAFAYASLEKPAFTPDDVIEFYEDAGFTHGCAPDHIIFEFDTQNPPVSSVSEKIRERYEITLNNAEEFIKLAPSGRASFEPIGPIQGWSPESMADAAFEMEKMGYKYLAVGGLVPLRSEAIHACLIKIREKINPKIKLHLLGFAKAEQIDQFVKYDITSFDSTSPLIRAFKDSRRNYFLESPKGGLEYYSAIRIPQATENNKLVQAIKMGILKTEDLVAKERGALEAIYSFDRGETNVETALELLLNYQHYLTRAIGHTELEQQKELANNRILMQKTLEAKPWKRCKCSICEEIGVDVIIFRSSNRNKRRGFHNLGVYHQHVQRTVSNNL